MDCFSEMAEQYAALLTSRMNIRTSRAMDRTLCNEVFALRFLQQHGAAHPKELSEEFMISSARMAVILKQLEAKGSIARTNDPQDSRQTIIQITAAGREFFEACNARIVDFIVRIFEKIGEKDARELIRINQEMMRVIAEGR